MGKRVLVTGGGGAGIGAAVVDELLALGAEVHAIDVKPVEADVASSHVHDARDMHANRAVLDEIGPVDAFFSCVGLARLSPADDIVAVNFLSVRALADAVAERMRAGGAICVASSIAGSTWRAYLDQIDQLLATPDFASGLAWLRQRSYTPDPYPFSKMCLVVWMMRRCRALGARGIRINAVSPGATWTPLLRASFEAHPEVRAAVEASDRALPRMLTPREQARPMVFLNSDAASYVTGVDLVVDGGELALRDPSHQGWV